MNGAIAEPLVRTTSPPNTTIMIRIGISQNFFRTRMKRHSSVRKSISFSQPSLFERDPLPKRAPACSGSRFSELVFHRLGRRTGRLPYDPVAFGVRLPFEPQQILAHRARDETGRQYRAVKQQRHHDGVDHAMKQQPEFQPYPLERIEDRRAQQGRRQEQRSQSARPWPDTPDVPGIEQAHDRKRARHHEAERTIGSRDDLLLAGEYFVS